MAESRDWAAVRVAPVIRRETSSPFQVVPVHKESPGRVTASFEPKDIAFHSEGSPGSYEPNKRRPAFVQFLSLGAFLLRLFDKTYTIRQPCSNTSHPMAGSSGAELSALRAAGPTSPPPAWPRGRPAGKRGCAGFRSPPGCRSCWRGQTHRGPGRCPRGQSGDLQS